MSVIDLNRGGARGFGNGGTAMLPRAVRRVRAVVRKIHAAIAAARLHRLREEAERQSCMPLMLATNGTSEPGADLKAACARMPGACWF